METELEARLYKDCLRFRNAVESVKSRLSLRLQIFPRAACERASEVLGLYLHDLGYESIVIINGGSRLGYRHVWLEIDDFLIDITGDQFTPVELREMKTFGTQKSVEVTKDKSAWNKTYAHERNFRFGHLSFVDLPKDKSIQSDLKLIRSEIERQAANSA